MGGGASKRPATASAVSSMTSQHSNGHVLNRHASVDYSRTMPVNYQALGQSQLMYHPNYYVPQVPQVPQLPPVQPPRTPKTTVFSEQKYGSEVEKHVAKSPRILLLDILVRRAETEADSRSGLFFSPRILLLDILARQAETEADSRSGLFFSPRSLLLGGYPELVQYLCRSHYHWDDMCQVRAIFLWVATTDVYGLRPDPAQPPPRGCPLEYLLKIQANTGNQAGLVSFLCNQAGIPCVVINGMNKSAAYEVGDKVDRKRMSAQWNAVYVNGDWRLLDAFWASTCVVGRKSAEWTLVDADGRVTQEDAEASEGKAEHRLNEFYFLPDPDQLINTHFPDDSKWQLLNNPVTVKDFEEGVYIREAFHQNGMGLLPKSQTKVLLESVEGETELIFSLPENKSAHIKFKYMLYFGGKKQEESNAPLHRFVMFEQTSDVLKFSLRFPVKGKFKMDILATDTKMPDAQYDIACSYIITCNEPKKSCLPLPDVPSIGWGPVASTSEAGLKPITHEGATVVTEDGNVEIKLDAERNIQLHQMLKHAMIDDATLSNYAVTRLENGQVVVNLRLPQGGEYALKLYADDVGKEGVAPNVLNYLIKAEGKNISNVPFPNVSGGALSKKPVADSLGVSAVSHQGGVVEVKHGRERIQFQAPDNVTLMAELHTGDKRAAKTMNVKPVQKNGKWSFHVDLPDKGEYSLNVFACDKTDKDRIYNVHSYMVNSDGWDMDGEDEDSPEEAQENKPAVKHVPIETVQTSEMEVLIPVPPGFEDVCASLSRRNANDPPCKDQVTLVEHDGIRMFRATLPEYGEYQMSLYDRDEKGVVRNVAKYQVNRKPAGELYEDNAKLLMQNLGAEQTLGGAGKEETFVSSVGDAEEEGEDEAETDDANNAEDEKAEKQRRAARRQIRKAISMKDAELLRRRIEAYEKLCTDPDDEALAKARQTLAMLEAKEELVHACQQRDLDALKKAMARARAANVDHQLDLQLSVAASVRERLERLAKLHHAVLSLEGKTVTEIRTYANPPDGVHQSMMATFILLGNTPKEVKVWKTCKALMGRTGQESLMRRISKFDPRDCSVAAARLAKQTVAEYTMSQIRDVSAGAATFFTWSLGMIEEVESVGGCGTSGASRKLK